jgi:hypothetical protein
MRRHEPDPPTNRATAGSYDGMLSSVAVSVPGGDVVLGVVGGPERLPTSYAKLGPNRPPDEETA